MRPDRLLTPDEKAGIIGAIREAESRTAGEIVIRIIANCLGSTRRRAEKEFLRLGVHRTRDRSGVLVLLVLSRRRIEVLADAGIAERVPQPAWDALVSGISSRFREGAYAEGLVAAVGGIGALLAEHFPRRGDDIDELPNEISTG